MGVVTEHLLNKIRRQVAERKIVVWFDDEGTYPEVAAMLRCDGLAVEAYEGSFFELRRRIDPYLDGGEPQPLVVYVPLPQHQTEGALLEACAAGCVMKPGDQSTSILCNTRLRVIAREALQERLQEPALLQVLAQVEKGLLTLTDLDRLAEQGGEARTGALTVIFEATEPQEIALRFVSTDDYDTQLVDKKATREVASFLADLLGCPAVEGEPSALRQATTRHLLLIEMIQAAEENVPPHLQQRVASTTATQRARACEITTRWRQRRDLQDAYARAACAVAGDLLAPEVAASASVEVMVRLETFRDFDVALQRHVEAALQQSPDRSLIELAENRRQAFWSSVDGEIHERWALIVTAGRLLDAACRIEPLIARRRPLVETIAGYTDTTRTDEISWHLLDTHHRHLERRFHQLDPDVSGAHETLQSLVVRARARYHEVAAKMADTFSDALLAGATSAPDVPRQRGLFEGYVAPALDKGRTALVLVDALRYEMACEMQEGLGVAYESSLDSVLGTLPSFTEVGMAAVLPLAGRDMALVPGARGKVAAVIDGETLHDRADRMRYIEQRVEGEVVTMTMGDLLPPAEALRRKIKKARLVVVTASDELDGLCELGNEPLARRLMDDVLVQVRRCTRVLCDLGVETVIITSDHGYLFREALDSGSLVDPPGGQTVDLHRRVWVGRGGDASERFRRVRARDVGLGGDLELAFPHGLSGFKVAGSSRAFLHGGPSPQELILPVAVVRRRGPAAATSADIEWDLQPSSKRLTTRFASVQVAGKLSQLFLPSPPLVRVELREGGEVLSRVVSATYGFEDGTGFVQMEAGEGVLQPNTVTLALLKTPRAKSVQVVLVDAVSDAPLHAIDDLPVALGGF